MAPISEDDRRLLLFAADQRAILREHTEELLGISARSAGRRLRTLLDGGLLAAAEDYTGGRTRYRITRPGLRAVDSALSAAPRDSRQTRHDEGVAWLHLAAQGGGLGTCTDIISERRMRSEDRRGEHGAAQHGVALGGWDQRGERRMHYPDLMLVDPGGRRIAVELELSGKGPQRRDRIMGGYASAGNVDVVLYLVETPALARSIRGTAAAFGISERVHVQYVEAPREADRGAPGRSPAHRQATSPPPSRRAAESAR